MKRIILLVLLLFAIGCAKEIETPPTEPSEEIETTKISGEVVSSGIRMTKESSAEEYELLERTLDILIKVGNKINPGAYAELKQRTDALADKGTDVSSLREKLEAISSK